MYEYRTRILRVVDGDTVHADVDLGFDSHQLLTLRLAGINTPELPTPEGQAAQDALEAMVAAQVGGVVVIRTIKDRREKYGRYLATLYPLDGGVSFNERLVMAGHAVRV